jgi:UDP-N-acetylmuramate dehydrogenase
LLFTKNFQGLTLQIATKGIEIIKKTSEKVLVEVQAGENWHEFVLWSLSNNLGGIENLALIPGSVGAAPIQNIGAYGVELKSVFHSCKAFETSTRKIHNFSNDECQFGYRDSIFKKKLKGKFIIISVCFTLQQFPHSINISYGAIHSQLANKTATIQNIAEAVISIRLSKLPNPKQIGNSGSFFKNPIITLNNYRKLQQLFPKIPQYPNKEGFVKIPAGWIIESLGFKGMREGDAGVHEKQALVLVNYGTASGNEILELSKKIQKAALDKFGISLETEVNIL